MLVLPFLCGSSALRYALDGNHVERVIEGTQLQLSLLIRAGYPRVDVNDVLNFAGVLLGYAGYRLFVTLMRRFNSDKKMQTRVFAGHGLISVRGDRKEPFLGGRFFLMKLTGRYMVSEPECFCQKTL
ncbi:hypothetical protein [Paenibacillus sp. UNC499MF]|uniref:hypothetical protein n=1 Tax=Paenibacillus sp. UNC499MF TaxID=1502751 RepID=UPI0011B01C7A|nr:hypothetical protein [Paenibacillus sp. UNC499MF]